MRNLMIRVIGVLLAVALAVPIMVNPETEASQAVSAAEIPTEVNAAKALDVIENLIKTDPEKATGDQALRSFNSALGIESDIINVVTLGEPELLLGGLDTVTDWAGKFGVAVATYQMCYDLQDPAKANTAALSALQSYLSWALGSMGKGGAIAAAGANFLYLSLDLMGKTVTESVNKMWWNAYLKWQKDNPPRSARDFDRILRESGWKGLFHRIDSFWEDPAVCAIQGYDFLKTQYPNFKSLKFDFRSHYLREVVFPQLLPLLKKRMKETRMWAELDMQKAVEEMGIRARVKVVENKTEQPIPNAIVEADGFKVKKEAGKYLLFLPLQKLQKDWKKGKRSYRIVAKLENTKQKQEITFETRQLATNRRTLIHTFKFDVWKMRISPSSVVLPAGKKQKFEAIITNIADPRAALPSEFQQDVNWETEGDISTRMEFPNWRTVVLAAPEKLEASSVSGKITGKLYIGSGGSLRVFLQASAKVTVKAEALIELELVKKWYDDDGFKIREEYTVYRRDGRKIKHGTYKWWYKSGQKFRQCEYKDGKLCGTWTEWHENGQMMEQGEFKDGKQCGTYKRWYENGQMESQGKYKDGKACGTWTGWHENGQMAGQCEYKDGKLCGTRTTWYENGQMESQGEYKDGKPCGTWTLWGSDGEVGPKGNYGPCP